ncbi:MAG: hypothetical protein ACI9R3_002280 [Verrucomicrobiales bacterium]|jgi:hypothetical protein
MNPQIIHCLPNTRPPRSRANLNGRVPYSIASLPCSIRGAVWCVLISLLVWIAPSLSRAQDVVLNPGYIVGNDIEGGPPIRVIGEPLLEFQTSEIGGAVAQALSFPKFLVTEYLTADNPIGPNGWDFATETNEYTLVMDVMFPSLKNSTALMQASVGNTSGCELAILGGRHSFEPAAPRQKNSCGRVGCGSLWRFQHVEPHNWCVSG